VCEWAGVACPVARGLLALGSAVLGRDLRASGRTLENLQLAHLRIPEMKQMLHDGSR
jgi:opine dehydrogenase